jgi:serine/threonine protein kinase
MSPPTVSEHDALPAGTRLGEFEIECVLGVGGFGIVYRAFDHALERRVAVKEYMPAALATRGAEHRVALRSAHHADTFQLGLRSFINEARLLARFDHPALVKVYRFWEANDTAYMVMPWYEGTTLLEARRAMGHPPTPAWLRSLLDPMLGALDVLHKAQVFHRDIAPDNILLLGDASGQSGHALPVLLDFGAARRVIGDHTQTLTAIVKPSFAPIEQYAESPQLRQGPWTDLYALGAVVHYCITGRPPMPATARAVHDELPPLLGMAPALARDFGRAYAPAFLAAVDHALAVRPDERPPSVGLWRAALDGHVSASAEAVSVVPPALERTVFVGSVHGARPDTSAYATTVPAASPLRQLLSGDTAVLEEGEDAGDAAAPPAPRAQPAAPGAVLSAVAAPVVAPVTAPAPGQPEAAPSGPGAPGSEPAGWVPTRPVGPAAPVVAEPASQRRLVAAVAVVAVLGLSAALGLNSMLKRGAGASGVAAAAPGDGTSGPLAGASAIVPAAAVPGADPPAAGGPGSPDDLAVSGPPAAAVTPAEPAPARAGQRAGATTAAPHGGPVAARREAADARASRVVAPVAAADVALPPSDVPDAARNPAGRAARATAEPAPRREVAAGPLNPRAACGDRFFIALALCMKRYCSRPEYTRHGECARMREQEEANRQMLP